LSQVMSRLVLSRLTISSWLNLRQRQSTNALFFSV
jgi:hypothetical protein